jgi:hypothetical protein
VSVRIDAAELGNAALKQHKLSAAFPPMAEHEYLELSDSIEIAGVLNPIVIFEGEILDGWHRYCAAQTLGMACPAVELDALTDPRDFVLAQNRYRRHISAAQSAMATSAVYAWQSNGRPGGEKPGTECRVSKTTSQLAEIAGTSERTIRQAKAVQTGAGPEVQEAVRRGEIGLPKAAAIAKLPQREQAAALTAPSPPAPAAAPKPAAPAPSPEVGLEGQLAELQERIADLGADLAAAQAEIDAMAKVFDADDKLKAATDQVKQLSAQIVALNQRINGLMNEKNEAIRAAKAAQRKVAKLEGEKAGGQ